MKRLIRSVLAQGCQWSGATARAEAAIRNRLVVLCYHRVLPADRKAAYFQPDLVVTPAALRAQCRTLLEHYDIRPLGEAWSKLRSGARIERPLASMTFDDGYEDNLRFAAPILSEAGIQATFFVVSDLVGADQPPWYDRVAACVSRISASMRGPDVDARLKSLISAPNDAHPNDGPMTPYRAVAQCKQLTVQGRAEVLRGLELLAGGPTVFSADDLIMNPKEIGELVNRGHEIGSHSRTHPILPPLDDRTLRDEVVGSKAELESIIGRRVTSFCYPNGDVDDRVEKAVAEAGYDCATAVEFGVNSAAENPLRLRRWFMHEERLRGATGEPSRALLRMELSGLADRVFRRRREPLPR